MSTKYWVLYGDWDVGEYSDDVWIKMANFEIHTLPDPPKTDKIDERTIKNVGFDTLEEAEKHAANVIKDGHDDWLAFVKIEKTTTETIKEYDIERLKVLR